MENNYGMGDIDSIFDQAHCMANSSISVPASSGAMEIHHDCRIRWLRNGMI
jgi:hypothetical protein